MKKKDSKIFAINALSNLFGSINFNLDDCFNSKFDIIISIKSMNIPT